MTRTPQVALAFIGIAVVPSIVGAVTADQSKPADTALTVRVVNPGAKQLLHITENVAMPKEIDVVLHDKAGQHVSAIDPAPGECEHLDFHQATDGENGQEWCLALEDLYPGHEVSAKVGSLALTVDAADGWWFGPFGLAFLGLLLGMAAALTPPGLRRRVRSQRLEALLDTPNAQAISGLADWVADRRAAAVPDDELVPMVNTIVRFGPNLARQARARLEAALEASDVPADGALREAAAAEAAAPTSIAEFYDHGKQIEVHPLEAWTAAVEKLGKLERVLHDMAPAIEKLAEDDVRRQDYTKAGNALRNANSPEAVTKVAELVAALAADMPAKSWPYSYIVAPSGPVTVPETIVREQPSLPPFVPDPPKVKLRLDVTLVTGTVVLAVLATAWALLVLYETVYVTKASFGTADDYAASLIAAVGSGGAGAVLGLIAYWDASAPANSS